MQLFMTGADCGITGCAGSVSLPGGGPVSGWSSHRVRLCLFSPRLGGVTILPVYLLPLLFTRKW